MLAVVPDDPGSGHQDPHGDGDEEAPSLWEDLTEQAVRPFVIALPDPDPPEDDPDAVLEWAIRAPDRDGVADLDDQPRPLDQLAGLIGNERVADDVLDALDRLDWDITLDLLADLRAHFALPDLPPGLWTHLVEQVDVYGEAIEADLWLGGIGYSGGADLLDWFRGLRPWPQLARLLRRFPEGSRYFAAILDDEDLAEQRIAEGVEPPAPRKRPPLEGETQDRMLLRAAVSALHRVEHAVFAAQVGKKAGRAPRPLPGPETADERVREVHAIAEVEDLFDQVSPGWRGPSLAAPTGHHQRDSGLIVPD